MNISIIFLFFFLFFWAYQSLFFIEYVNWKYTLHMTDMMCDVLFCTLGCGIYLHDPIYDYKRERDDSNVSRYMAIEKDPHKLFE